MPTITIINRETDFRQTIRPRIAGRVKRVKPIVVQDNEVNVFVTALAALGFLRKLKPGARLIYHYGNLAADRQCVLRKADEKIRATTLSATEADKVGTIMLKAYEYGLVELVQVKLANDDGPFKAYVAVRTEKPFSGENHVFQDNEQPAAQASAA